MKNKNNSNQRFGIRLLDQIRFPLYILTDPPILLRKYLNLKLLYFHFAELVVNWKKMALAFISFETIG